MKYILYRSLGDLDKAVKKHERVAVETGKNIDDVTDALVKAAADDLAGMPEYERCETAAYAPEPVKDFRKVRRYQYEMTAQHGLVGQQPRELGWNGEIGRPAVLVEIDSVPRPHQRVERPRGRATGRGLDQGRGRADGAHGGDA